ncbi:MAG: sigma-70 family RNA polymerase sigma factor [Planctomycetota bacterium]|jgi:RNA polymerase sigma factor (TIGR02999 family)
MAAPTPDATRIVTELTQGDASAAEKLMPLVYDELRGLANRYFRREAPGNTLQPTTVVNEAFLRLVDQSSAAWNNRAHFVGVAARAMRQVLVDHARRRGAEKRGGGWARVTLSEAGSAPELGRVDVLALEEALDGLAALDERKARVVELRFLGGLSNEEVAHVLGVSVTTVEGDWRVARAWLRRELSGGETR